MPPAPPPSWSALFREFGRIGLMSFGGPAAQIAIMHRVLVDETRWLAEKSFLGALSFCMLLPGPEAMQLATYAGWRLRGVPGGLLAGLLFVLPGAAVIFALAFGYVAWGDVPLVQSAFLGIKAAVVAIVVQALLRLARKALHGPEDIALAALSFFAIYALGLPFPAIIALAAAWGALRARTRTRTTADPSAPEPGPAPVPVSATLRQVALWAVLWLAPLAVLSLAGQDFLATLGTFFAKLAVVSFGGAYAVLAYMAQAVVQDFGWLAPEQMIDALGLAETTPGPLILVTQFVGILAGISQGGTGAGLVAGALTLWMTFVPCFLWIFAFAPHVERLLAQPRLAGALAAITAGVVGVIANLALWFALHVMFSEVTQAGAAALPRLSTLDPVALALVLLAAGLLWRGLSLAWVICLPASAALLGGLAFAP